MTALHTPLRPAWICAGCAQDWPCPTRRGQLTAEYDRAPVCLSLVMASRFVEASEDLCDVPAGELRRRFLGWLRRPMPGRRAVQTSLSAAVSQVDTSGGIPSGLPSLPTPTIDAYRQRW